MPVNHVRRCVLALMMKEAHFLRVVHFLIFLLLVCENIEYNYLCEVWLARRADGLGVLAECWGIVVTTIGPRLKPSWCIHRSARSYRQAIPEREPPSPGSCR